MQNWGGGHLYRYGKGLESHDRWWITWVGNSRTLFPPLGLKTNDGTVPGRAAATGQGPLVNDTAITNLSSSKEGQEGISTETSGLLLVSCQSFQIAKPSWDTESKEGARWRYPQERGGEKELERQRYPTHYLSFSNSAKTPTLILQGHYLSFSCCHAWLFAAPCTAACQTSLSFTISWSLLSFMSVESMMLSNHTLLPKPDKDSQKKKIYI